MKGKLVEAFQTQAEACESLGSSFTGGLCRLLALHLDEGTAVGSLCLNWPGDPSASADSIPLRLCGGLHALVLSGRDGTLAGFYPPNAPNVPPWKIVKRTLAQHENFLLKWMQSPPQTNEVSRSAAIWPSLMTIAARTERPLHLLEVGASGGLNLRADRFGYRLNGVRCGETTSPLQISPQWRGSRPVVANPEILSRKGCDLNPLDPQNPQDRLRLRAYLWPAQPDRMARLNAALNIARQEPARVERVDAIAWLDDRLSNLDHDACTVIYSTIAWQYLPQAARARGEDIVTRRGRALEKGQLAWLRFEADDKTPGAGIRLQLWPDGIDANLGRADFHGRWVDWRGL